VNFVLIVFRLDVRGGALAVEETFGRVFMHFSRRNAALLELLVDEDGLAAVAADEVVIVAWLVDGHHLSISPLWIAVWIARLWQVDTTGIHLHQFYFFRVGGLLAALIRYLHEFISEF
jgi:hypothetical protein